MRIDSFVRGKVGAQKRRAENATWHKNDLLGIHSAGGEDRGINSGEG
jgi:hypothetical protein